MYCIRVGSQRCKQALPLREIYDAGVIASGGSDAPVFDMNPFLGISAVVNTPNEAQRLDVREGLQLYTINGAKVGLKENEHGSLEIGKNADLIMISENPFEINPKKLGDIDVILTMVGGEIKYQKNV